MANLSIRKLDDNVYRYLQAQALAKGISMEEEVRGLITRAVNLPEKLSSVFKKHFGKKNGVDLALSSRNSHDPIDFK